MPDGITTKLTGRISLQGFSGDLKMSSLSGSLQLPSSTPVENDYDKLKNKPKINGVKLESNKSFEELGCDSVTNTELKSIYDSIIGTYYKKGD